MQALASSISSGIVVFTDGSKKDGLSGAGNAIAVDGIPLVEVSVPLGAFPTVL